MLERIKTRKSPWYIVIIFIFTFILFLPFILIISLIFLIPWLNARFIQRPRLLREIKDKWLPQNKFILFIYSDNELWKEYSEKNIIPKISSNSVILNWSRRKEWIDSNALESRIFKNFQWGREWVWRRGVRMGSQDYNHMAIVFKPWNRPKIINFRKAFKEYEFGKNEKLKFTENELYAYL